MDAPPYTFRRFQFALGSALVWRAIASTNGAYTEAGTECWGLAFHAAASGTVSAVAHGPSVEPRVLTASAGDVSWGVEFAAHHYLVDVPKCDLVGRLVPMKLEAGRLFIGTARLPVPGFGELEEFVDVLCANGLVDSDPVVADLLDGSTPCLSDRQARRRVRRVAGLTTKQIRSLRRAERANSMIRAGCPLADVAIATGFSDQAHMTRSLRAIAGGTPSKLIREEPGRFASRPPQRDDRILQDPG